MIDYSDLRSQLLNLDHDCHAGEEDGCDWCLKVRQADEAKLREMAVYCLPWDETEAIREYNRKK